jgi:hypothetical protein
MHLLRKSLALALAGAVVLALPIVANAVVINEIRIDQPSTDVAEFFELQGDPGESLDGLSYVVVGDGTGGSGVIEFSGVIDLTGLVIPADGHFLACESTHPNVADADLVVSLGFENGDNVTHFLVLNNTGAPGDDLDIDDDCVLDIEPWDAVVDKIAMIEEENPPTGTECHYGPPTVGPDGTFVPGHVYRCDTEWRIGTFDPADPAAADTPGVYNTPCDPVSADQDSWGAIKSRF